MLFPKLNVYLPTENVGHGMSRPQKILSFRFRPTAERHFRLSLDTSAGLKAVFFGNIQCFSDYGAYYILFGGKNTVFSI